MKIQVFHINFCVIFFPLLNNGPKMAEFTRDVAALQDFASMGCKKIGLTYSKSILETNPLLTIYYRPRLLEPVASKNYEFENRQNRNCNRTFFACSAYQKFNPKDEIRDISSKVSSKNTPKSFQTMTEEFKSITFGKDE